MASNLFLAAKTAYQSGNYAVAEELCNRILTSDGNDVGTKALLGLTYGQTGRKTDAIRLLEHVVRITPDSWGVCNALSILLREADRFDEAIVYRRHALALRPDDDRGHGELALCLMAKRRFELAEQELRTAVALAPSDPLHYCNLAVLYTQMGRVSEVESAYTKALEVGPNDASALSGMGDLKIGQFKREEAIDLFRRAFEAAPDTVVGRTSRAKYAAELGDSETVREVLDGLHAEFPDSAEMLAMAGQIYAKTGAFDLAVDRLQAALRLRPDHVEAYSAYAKYKRIDDGDRRIVSGMKELLPNVVSDRDRMSLHFALGKSLDDLQEYERAMEHFDAANVVGERIRDATYGAFEPKRIAGVIDDLMRRFTPDFFDHNRHLGSESEKPVLIVGMMRSGTTLTDQILSSHSQVAAVGEHAYWMDIGRAFVSSKLTSLDAAQVSEVASRYLEILNKLGPDSLRVTDKNPSNYMTLGWFHLCFPRGRIIHCRRRPIDNCLSIYITPTPNPPEYGCNRGNIVFMYRQYERLMGHWRRVLPNDRFMEIEYESLVANREEETRRLIAFCGLEWEDGCLRHEANAKSVGTPSVWQARQPIYTTSVERWRNYEPWLGEFRQLL